MKNITPKKAKILFWIILLTGFVISLIGAFLEITALTVIGILVMLSSAIFRTKAKQ